MRRPLIALALALAVGPALAQMPTTPPGSMDVARVKAGTYKVDPGHTQVAWSVNHFGISIYHGLFGDITGSLTIDPANIGATSVNIQIPVDKVVTTSSGLNAHLLRDDFFDAAKFPTASFVSTKVEAQGTSATITGNLTLHGVTKPVVLKARFTGAGDHPMNKKLNIGFAAETSIKRSEFGMGSFVPMVADNVDLNITAAFELG